MAPWPALAPGLGVARRPYALSPPLVSHLGDATWC
jgi:hypothetical protein